MPDVVSVATTMRSRSSRPSKHDNFTQIVSPASSSLLRSELPGVRANRTCTDLSSRGWHSDITFEPVPSDYAILRLTELPKTGGDTLWASGYEIYDRISPAYQKFLETLTVTCAQPIFQESAKNNGFELFAGPRGAAENVGTDLKAVHPVVRTNPVTGWKSIFAVGHHAKRINELAEGESDALLKWFGVFDGHCMYIPS